MKTLRRTDIVVIGGGWTGLMMAKELGARTGLNISVLERGKPRKTADYHESMDELDYAIRLRLMQDVSKDTFTFRHTTADRALPLRQHGSVLPGSGTGGAGEHWGAAPGGLAPMPFSFAPTWWSDTERPSCRRITCCRIGVAATRRWSHGTRAQSN